MMIKKIKIGHLRITWVIRHQWEKNEPETFLMRSTRELGLFFRKSMAVGTRKRGRAMFDGDNLSPSYMFGLKLIWAKTWISVDWRVMHFGEGKK
jgi:hypothetical protein